MRKIIRKIIRKIKSVWNNPPPIKFYASFSEASENATTYLDSDIADIVVKKTLRLKNSDQLNLSRKFDSQLTQNHFILYHILSIGKSTALSVIDWGGAAGATYLQLQKLFDHAIGQWSVLETPIMAALARPLENQKLKFFEAAEAAYNHVNNKDDITLWAQGILNFIDNPLKQISELIKINPQFIYVSRTWFSMEREYILQFKASLRDHGPGQIDDVQEKVTSYPFTIIHWVPFQDLLSNNGYQINFLFEEGNEMIGTQPVKVYGLLASKNL